jgi:hypothetical protein
MKALSIRQPWAWLIVHACKDIENREWPTKLRGKFHIHAGKTMTKADYEACALFCSSLPPLTLPEDFEFPSFESLKKECGGLVGVMRITDCVNQSPSPWFCGPYGFVIEAATSNPFIPYKGSLGFFNVDLLESEP